MRLIDVNDITKKRVEQGTPIKEEIHQNNEGKAASFKRESSFFTGYRNRRLVVKGRIRGRRIMKGIAERTLITE